MKKLKLYLTIFVTGLVAGIAVLLQLTRSDSDDSELLELRNEGDKLSGEIDGLEAELDGLEVGELTDDESAKFWGDL